MIQRIQSLYLLVALLVTGSLLFTNMLYLETTTASMALRQNGLFVVTGNADLIGRTMPLQLMLTVTLLLLLVTIFLFKKRQLQLRICGINLAMHAGLSVLIFYYGKHFSKLFNAELSFNWPLVLPVVSIVLLLLAMRSILSDELLIKSIDRIR